MRTVELAKVAAAAEALRLRRLVRRQGMRAVFGAIAGVFAIAVLVLLHVIAYLLLLRVVAPVIAALIVLVVDLIVAGVLGGLAMRDAPDTVEAEALEVRRQAVIEMRKSATALSLAGQVGSLVLRRRVSSALSPQNARGWLLGRLADRVLARR